MDVSTMTAATPVADFDLEDSLASLVETASCCAEVGHGGFFPNLTFEDYDTDTH